MTDTPSGWRDIANALERALMFSWLDERRVGIPTAAVRDDNLPRHCKLGGAGVTQQSLLTTQLNALTVQINTITVQS